MGPHHQRLAILLSFPRSPGRLLHLAGFCSCFFLESVSSEVTLTDDSGGGMVGIWVFFFFLNWDPLWVAVDMDMARKTVSLS